MFVFGSFKSLIPLIMTYCFKNYTIFLVYEAQLIVYSKVIEIINRYQYVKILNSTSNPIQVTCGVLLRSFSGLFLFLLYLNDLLLATTFSATLFADDTLLMISDKNSKR